MTSETPQEWTEKQIGEMVEQHNFRKYDGEAAYSMLNVVRVDMQTIIDSLRQQVESLAKERDDWQRKAMGAARALAQRTPEKTLALLPLWLRDCVAEYDRLTQQVESLTRELGEAREWEAVPYHKIPGDDPMFIKDGQIYFMDWEEWESDEWLGADWEEDESVLAAMRHWTFGGSKDWLIMQRRKEATSVLRTE